MEIHIGNRVADVELLGKDGNKVRLDIDGQPYEVDIVMAENAAASARTRRTAPPPAHPPVRAAILLQ